MSENTKYPVGGWTGWQGFALWKDKVDSELVEIRARIDTIAVALNAATPDSKTGQSGGPTGGSGSGGPTDYIPIDQRLPFQYQASDKLTGILPFTSSAGQDYLTGSGEGDEDEKNMTDSLVQSTYGIRTATIAMRGYLMLVEQMGLSKDQKKMVSEIETAMMAIMKIASAISVLSGALEAGTGNPMGIVQMIMAGGYLSGGIAYGNKTVGGVI